MLRLLIFAVQMMGKQRHERRVLYVCAPNLSEPPTAAAEQTMYHYSQHTTGYVCVHSEIERDGGERRSLSYFLRASRHDK